MSFETKDWKNGNGGGTKLNAAGLVDLEERLASFAEESGGGLSKEEIEKLIEEAGGGLSKAEVESLAEEIASGTTIHTDQIADDAITQAKLGAGSVAEAALATAVKTKLAEGGTVKTAVAASGVATALYDAEAETWEARPEGFARVVFVSPVHSAPDPTDAEDFDQIIRPRG